MQKINLKKQVKLMVFFLINLKRKIMITLVMQLLKMVVVVKVGLEDLVDLVVQIFQTYLKISLENLVVVDVVQEDGILVIEVLI